MAEIEPDLDDFGEESGVFGDFPNGGGHFEERVNGDNCVCSKNVSAETFDWLV